MDHVQINKAMEKKQVIMGKNWHTDELKKIEVQISEWRCGNRGQQQFPLEAMI